RQTKPRMVVDQRERVTKLAVGQREFSFKVQLLLLVRAGSLEALLGALARWVGVVLKQSVAGQDRRNRTGGWIQVVWYRYLASLSLIHQVTAQLASAPAGIVFTCLYDQHLDGFRRLVWAVVGTPRALGQPLKTFFSVARQPLVAGLSANVIATTQLAHIAVWLVGHLNKFGFKFHRSLIFLPRHKYLLFWKLSYKNLCLQKVLPMSPNTCVGCPRSRHRRGTQFLELIREEFRGMKSNDLKMQ